MIEVKTSLVTPGIESDPGLASRKVAPLENGERLNATEFLRRYDDDGARLLEVLNQGLASAEHAAFLEKLVGLKGALFPIN